MPFLPPNQQRQSTEGKNYWIKYSVIYEPIEFVAVILKVLLVNLLAVLNFANVFLK